MTTVTMSVEERLRRIEARLDPATTAFVTKADLASFRAELSQDMLRMTWALAMLHLVGIGTIAAVVKFIG